MVGSVKESEVAQTPRPWRGFASRHGDWPFFSRLLACLTIPSLCCPGCRKIAASGQIAQPKYPAVANSHPGSVFGALLSDASISPDGKYIAVAASIITASKLTSGFVDIISWQNGGTSRINNPHAGPLTTVRFSHDGKSIATAGLDKTVRIWSVSTGNLVKTIPVRFETIGEVAFSPNDRYIAVAGGYLNLPDGSMEVYSVLTCRVYRAVQRYKLGGVTCSYDPSGKLLAFGTASSAAILDASSLHVKWKLPTDKEGVISTSFSDDGRMIACATSETARVFDMASRKLRWSMAFPDGSLCGFALCSNGKAAVLGLSDSRIIQADIVSGKVIKTIGLDSGPAKLDYGPAKSVRSASDGRHVVIATLYGRVVILDAVTHRLVFDRSIVPRLPD